MLHKILVPLDGSKLAEKALPYAEALAQKFEGELILVWILPHPIVVPVDYGGLSVATLETMVTQAEDMAHEYLQELLTQYQQKNIPTRVLVQKSQNVADAIIDLAAQEGVDVIVKTTHGRSGVSRWLFGNVALKVLQGSPCPVFLVRIGEEDMV